MTALFDRPPKSYRPVSQFQMASPLPFLDCPTYKWIFVGGKGGVGKTTTACSIALSLARTRNRVLLVSTDPASNIGDVFQQHFVREALPVQSVPNLWAMEFLCTPEVGDESFSLLQSLPGMDEMHALSSLFDSIERDDFDVVVFDTATTGHTMQLLRLPQAFQEVMGSLGMFGGAAMAIERCSETHECEGIQFLEDKHIESHTLVVNQIMPSRPTNGCSLCLKRYQTHAKYLADIRDLYSDWPRVEVPISRN
jgi:arsenite-transporting ATPase